ncbi:FadR/GntR family transcriptional regulator [Parasphingopyxis marina]|uniref:FadR family transcriptional regulator n=1 Tax=Parasphingopyxis marina TaxID=2761622 RepID=A0A842HVW7_9SPHN|nr:GntR family transcriptional regulator [Parasphingopyxis marina]MBC2776633.1 FadR family transcriptional regulator [Parasphingopyxis marina]
MTMMKPNHKPLSKRSLKASEMVARDIVTFITEGGYSTGDMLPREQLMQEQFQVGRGSLREALRLLEVQGLIAIKPGVSGGPIVGEASATGLARTLSLFFRMLGATYEDVSDALLILAPLVARRAARNGNRDEIAKELQEVLEVSECDGQTATESTRNAAQFHTTLNRLNGNPVLALLTEALGALFNEHIVTHSDASGILPHCRNDHRLIADAVIARDSDNAAQLSYDHMKSLIEFHRTRVPAIFNEPVQWR